MRIIISPFICIAILVLVALSSILAVINLVAIIIEKGFFLLNFKWLTVMGALTLSYKKNPTIPLVCVYHPCYWAMTGFYGLLRLIYIAFKGLKVGTLRLLDGNIKALKLLDSFIKP